MEMLQGVWKQHLRPRVVVGYGLKIFIPSPPNYITRSPGRGFAKQDKSLLDKNSSFLFFSRFLLNEINTIS